MVRAGRWWCFYVRNLCIFILFMVLARKSFSDCLCRSSPPSGKKYGNCHKWNKNLNFSRGFPMGKLYDFLVNSELLLRIKTLHLFKVRNIKIIQSLRHYEETAAARLPYSIALLTSQHFLFIVTESVIYYNYFFTII